MLENLPEGIGRALRDTRPGLEALISQGEAARAAPDTIRLTSPAFADNTAIPARCTADGAGASPPLAWSGVPAGTAALLLVVEDADSPTPHPLVHAIVTDLAPADGSLAEGALPGPAGEGEEHEMGRNSFLRPAFLPPDPPPGHGPHRYGFQLLALDAVPDFQGNPGRSQVLDALAGHVIAKGVLVGLYERR